jgi:ATP-dependent DNA helicase PIF1
MEDYVRSGHEEEVAKNLTLKWIQDKLLLNNQLMENFSLPVPDFHLINQLIQAQIAADNDEVDTHEKRLLGQMMLEKLNDGQRAAFDLIMASIEDTNQPRLFFLDGPGGTSKMFLYNTLITVLQGQGKSVVAVASTGIASTLLSNGSTYHSKYKLYPPIT